MAKIPDHLSCPACVGTLDGTLDDTGLCNGCGHRAYDEDLADGNPDPIDPAAIRKADIVKMIDGAPLHTHESVERLADSILALIGSDENERIMAARRVLTNGEAPPSLRIKTALKIL